jgi:hypothetical protein
MPLNRAAIIALVVAIAALLALVFIAGWADDKAPPGSQGRGTVTRTR